MFFRRQYAYCPYVSQRAERRQKTKHLLHRRRRAQKGFRISQKKQLQYNQLRRGHRQGLRGQKFARQGSNDYFRRRLSQQRKIRFAVVERVRIHRTVFGSGGLYASRQKQSQSRRGFRISRLERYKAGKSKQKYRDRITLLFYALSAPASGRRATEGRE